MDETRYSLRETDFDALAVIQNAVEPDWNDSLNAPMWTLNRGLGFQKAREMIQLESDIGEATDKQGPAA